jgi:hypothetical protein
MVKTVWPPRRTTLSGGVKTAVPWVGKVPPQNI